MSANTAMLGFVVVVDVVVVVPACGGRAWP